jgi:hypothetical protein
MDRGVWEWEEAVSAFKQNKKIKKINKNSRKMDRGVWGWEEAVSAFKQNMKAKGFWNVPGGTDKV